MEGIWFRAYYRRFLSEVALKEAVKNLYQSGDCDWDGKSHLNAEDPEQLEEILVEIELEDARYLNNRLDYVMIETFTSDCLKG